MPSARQVELPIAVAKASGKPTSHDVPGTQGLRVVVSIRAVAHALSVPGVDNLPPGTRAVSVFLVPRPNFLNVARAHRDETPDNQILKAAGDSFVRITGRA